MSLESGSFQEVINEKDRFWGQSKPLSHFVHARDWSLEEQHRVLALGSATLTPRSQFKYYQEKRGDVQWILDRVNTANSLTLHIWEHAKKINPNLYTQLIASKARETYELPGKPDEDSVASSYFHEIAPTAAPVGFFAPRLLMSLLGDKLDGLMVPKHAPKEISVRTVWMFEIMDKAIMTSDSPELFAVELAKSGYEAGLETNYIMSLLLKSHKYKEENNRTNNLKLVKALKENASEIWDEAIKLLNDEKKEGWKKMLREFLPDISS
jgi:hypothetical protein